MHKKISVKRLTLGMYVSLREIPWFNHPFLLSHFELKKQSEINDILAIGCDTVLYDPKKSRTKPLAEEHEVAVNRFDKKFISKTSLKSKKASELRKRRKRFQEVEKDFSVASEKAGWLFEEVKGRGIDSHENLKEFALNMSKRFSPNVDLAVQHINVSASDAGQHYHSLNVMILALMLGQQLGLEEDEMEKLSLGGLLHDIGFLRLSKEIVCKKKMSKAEMAIFREHPKYGVAMLSALPDFCPEVMKIVYQHHEECNGKGYPKRLEADQISPLAKIVAVVDTYDRLINTRDASLGLSPHKAMAFMFGKKGDSFDQECLGTFIKMLGVYPPGTVCRFSSGDVGVVVGVSPSDPLHPEVIIYDPAIPKYDAIIYKLGTDLDLDIETSLSLKEIDMEALYYLDSRSKIQYFPLGQ